MNNAELMIRIRANADEAKAAFSQVSGGLKQVSEQTQAMSRTMRQGAAESANMTAQLNDVFVMAAAGQNPMQLALQQGTQISQIFGSRGAAGSVALLRGAFVGLINPVTLGTVAILAGGTALFQWAQRAISAEGSAKTLDDQIDALAESMHDYRDAVEMTDPDRIVRVFGAQAGAAREFLEIQRQLAEVQTKIALSTATGATVESFGRFLDYDPQGILRIFSEVDRLKAEMDRLLSLSSDPSSVGSGVLTQIQNVQDQIDIFRGLTEDVTTLSEMLGVTSEQAEVFAAMIAKVGQADGAEAQASAARDLTLAMADATDNLGTANLEGKALYESLLQVVLKGLEFASIQGMEDPVRDAAIQSGILAENLRRALESSGAMARTHPRFGSIVAGRTGGFDADQFAAGFAARAGTPAGANDEALVRAVSAAAARTGYDPAIVLALMGVESGWNPGAVGGAGGNYQGLIQFGPSERQHYGVSAQSGISDQVSAAFQFLQDRGVRPGDDAARYYAAVLAGNANLVNAGDISNGGRVARVMDFVQGQDWQRWQARGQGLLSAYGGTVADEQGAVAASAAAQEAAAQAAERAGEAYQQLIASMNPAAAAQQAFTRGQEVLSEALASGRITTSEYAEAMGLLEDRHAQALAGMTDRLETMTASAQRGADAMANLFLSIGQGADAGKNALRSLLLEIARIQLVRGFRSLAESGPSAFSWLGSLLSLSGGGFTGNVPATQVAGVVHGGEYVFSKPAVDRIGLGALERLHSLRGYSNGGLVSGPNMRGPMDAASGFAGADITVRASPDVIVEIARGVVRQEAPAIQQSSVGATFEQMRRSKKGWA